MKITEHITINASVTKLWEILAENYAAMGDWSSAITHSEPNIKLPEGELGRTCHTAVGTVSETVIHLDEKERTFSYRTDRPPFFIRRAVNHYQILEATPETSILEMKAEVTLTPILAWIVYPWLKRYLNSLVYRFIEELKYYAETGNIHPRKLKALAKGTPNHHKTLSVP